jgi:hypothetical protein
MRLRCAAALLFLTLLLSGPPGCGDDSTTTTTARDRTPEATVEAPRPSGRRGHPEEYKGAYADARNICGISPSRKKVAEIVGSKSTRRKEIARALANGYKPRLRKKAYSGCLAGLK